MNNREKIDKYNQQTEIKYNQIKSNRMFECGCGKYHKIKSCDVIQTYWYVEPHGCIGGDYWNEGEIQIICPITNKKNRLFFKDHPTWKKRDIYKYSLEMQFKREYLHLFKNIIKDYDKDKRSWWNNYYFVKNYKRFDLKILE